MAHRKALDVRSKMLGVLIRAARLKAGKTLKGCAERLGCSAHTFSRYELGQRGISLPELELLAQYLDVPVSSFWEEGYDLAQEEPDLPPVEKLMPLRQKMVGVLLRQARLDASKSQKDCAKALRVSTDTISRYEYGKKPIPFPHLESLAAFVGVPVSHFVDRELASRRTFATTGPDGLLRAEEAWASLPPDLQEFIRDPDSLPYLVMARRMYDLPKDSLQHLAEAMLSIAE